jgi:acetylornithine/succinyldiaminopimelate/putrescine aminotransferase
MKELQKMCRERGMLLIMDESQTGLGKDRPDVGPSA